MDVEQLQKQFPLVKDLREGKEILWINPDRIPLRRQKRALN